ncbi:disulfide bond formation protein DsbB [Rhodopseudomonas rhenobacensis]|uniref:Disulfide bond formation protein DsbB n=1 Tax=Rhodopseudomonas rhenobacensis TaxID=87461 RepID=A0A7W7Z7G0_9BRAD|nr:disulfide bond formation protein DsbB [Rhodopseudomonas rhenobacensis]
MALNNLADTRSKAGPADARRNAARWAALSVAVIGGAALGGAWFFQLALNLVPCPLCLEQRYAYYLAIPLALAIALLARRGVPRGLLLGGLAVLALVMLGNAGLAAYHAGVEWGFWPGPSDCSGPIVDFSRGGLLDKLDSVKVVRCDEVQWRFLGLSLAGYNVLVSLAMAALAGRGAAALGSKK